MKIIVLNVEQIESNLSNVFAQKVLLMMEVLIFAKVRKQLYINK